MSNVDQARLTVQGVSVKTQRICIIVLVIAAASSAPVLSQSQNPQPTQTTQTASTRPTANRPEGVNPPAKVGKDYVIGADDVLDVSVWKEQELTRSLQVRPDGKISMPLLGDVQAAGLTPGQLAQNVTDKLKKYLTAPQVTIILTQINSQRVYVTGEVTRPGDFARHVNTLTVNLGKDDCYLGCSEILL